MKVNLLYTVKTKGAPYPFPERFLEGTKAYLYRPVFRKFISRAFIVVSPAPVWSPDGKNSHA